MPSAVTHTVRAPTYRDARVRAFRIAAEIEARNPHGWPVYVERYGDVSTRVVIELLHGDAEEAERAEEILAIAVRKAGR